MPAFTGIYQKTGEDMPTVLRIGPYRFFFFSKESAEPAHIHVEAGGKEAKIWLTDMRLASSYGMRPHELARIMSIAQEYRHTFLEAWNEYFTNNS